MNVMMILTRLLHEMELAKVSVINRMDVMLEDTPEWDALDLLAKNIDESIGTYKRLQSAINELEI